MYNFFKKMYNSFRSGIKKLRDASDYKKQERESELRRLNQRDLNYVAQLLHINRARSEERGVYEHLLNHTRGRYLTNISRIFKGEDLIQVEERGLGILYEFNKGPGFVVADKNLHEQSKKDLESRLFGISSSNGSFKNRDKKTRSSKYFAMKIPNSSSNCYSNQIANISSNNKGAISNIANALAGYVIDNKKIISPHKRTWASRISNLEDELLRNNFSNYDAVELVKIKNALSANKYLTKKKANHYKRAISLLDRAIERVDNA